MLILVQSTQSVERIGGSDIPILFEGLSLSVESVCAFTWALTVGFQVTSGMCICLVGTVLTLMECTFFH